MIFSTQVTPPLGSLASTDGPVPHRPVRPGVPPAGWGRSILTAAALVAGALQRSPLRVARSGPLVRDVVGGLGHHITSGPLRRAFTDTSAHKTGTFAREGRERPKAQRPRERVFVRRDDTEATKRLRTAAATVTPEAEEPAGRRVEWPTDDLRVLVGEARRPADELQQVPPRPAGPCSARCSRLSTPSPSSAP